MQESPITTFDEATTLVLEGAGSVTISSEGNISINNKTGWTTDDATLTTSDGGRKLTISLSGFSRVENNEFIANLISLGVGSGGGSTSVCDGTAVTTRGSIVTVRTKRGRTIVIDDSTGGVTIDGKAAGESQPKRPALQQQSFRLGKALTSISVKHSATLRITAPDVLSGVLSVSVEGSGRMMLTASEFQHVNVGVTGSGGVYADKVKTQTAMISVTGSGEVVGLHVQQGGQAAVTGSGQISITKAPGIDVIQTLTGSGRIRIK
jgi:hypothetical protein